MNKFLLTLALIITSSLSSIAQINEGSFTYDMTFDSNDEEMSLMMPLLEGSNFSLYFKNDESRAEVNMGTFMQMVTISNSKSEEVLMLMSVMMMDTSWAIKTSLSELDEGNTEELKPTIQLQSDTKEILGFTCKKAIVSYEGTNDAIYWYTDEIKVNKKGQTYLNDEIPGFPLEYEIVENGLNITLTATNYEKKLTKEQATELFNYDIPDGYEEMTLKELEQMNMN